MTEGDADCCAKRGCGHGEIWHPNCCLKRHAFIKPLIVEGKVLLIGDKFWYDYPGCEEFPNDPKGWIESTFSGTDPYGVVVKPKGFEKFVVSRNDVRRFRLSKPPP